MAPTNVAVTVNGHDLAKATVVAQGAGSAYHSKDYPDLLNSAITRELLIQEAQRQNLDKEESFRVSLKTFYEESLIKTLMDRQYDLPEVVVKDSEIDNFLSLYGKTVTFTRLPITTSPPKIDSSEKGVQNEVLFDDLAEPLKCLISSLKPGESAVKFDTGNEQYAIRLDKVTAAMDTPKSTPDREQVRKILGEHKYQQQITNWLHGLRNKASITIHNG